MKRTIETETKKVEQMVDGTKHKDYGKRPEVLDLMETLKIDGQTVAYLGDNQQIYLVAEWLQDMFGYKKLSSAPDIKKEDSIALAWFAILRACWLHVVIHNETSLMFTTKSGVEGGYDYASCAAFITKWIKDGLMK